MQAHPTVAVATSRRKAHSADTPWQTLNLHLRGGVRDASAPDRGGGHLAQEGPQRGRASANPNLCGRVPGRAHLTVAVATSRRKAHSADMPRRGTSCQGIGGRSSTKPSLSCQQRPWGHRGTAPTTIAVCSNEPICMKVPGAVLQHLSLRHLIHCRYAANKQNGICTCHVRFDSKNKPDAHNEHKA